MFSRLAYNFIDFNINEIRYDFNLLRHNNWYIITSSQKDCG
jgi:hypothetical protein